MRRSGRRRSEPRRYRIVGLMAYRLHHGLGVADKLGVQQIAGGESADNGPFAVGKDDLVAKRHSGELERRLDACDKFMRPGAEHSSGNHMESGPQRLARLSKAAQDYSRSR